MSEDQKTRLALTVLKQHTELPVHQEKSAAVDDLSRRTMLKLMGASAALALGVLVGAPWLVNPVLAGVSVLQCCSVAGIRRVGGQMQQFEPKHRVRADSVPVGCGEPFVTRSLGCCRSCCLVAIGA